MLNRIGNQMECSAKVPMPEMPSIYQRNEMEDMKKGIEYLYEFREKLSKLHPVVMDAIENMLQRNNRY